MNAKVLQGQRIPSAGTVSRKRAGRYAPVALMVGGAVIALVAASLAITVRARASRPDGAVTAEAGAEAERILAELKNYREVKVLPHVDNPFVMEAARRALLRAGYDLKL